MLTCSVPENQRPVFHTPLFLHFPSQPSQDNAKVGGLLLQWVKLASVAAQRPIAESEWSIVRPADVPRQRMRDCGAYTLLFAYCMARGLNVPARDTPIDMKAARQAFTYMLMTGRVGLRPLPVG